MGLLGNRNVRRSGSVRYAGQELTELNRKDLRSLWGTGMAMVFQDPMTSLNPVMKIGRQLTEGLRRHLDMSKDDDNATAVELLSSVGIPEPERRLSQYAHELAGQRKSVGKGQRGKVRVDPGWCRCMTKKMKNTN